MVDMIDLAVKRKRKVKLENLVSANINALVHAMKLCMLILQLIVQKTICYLNENCNLSTTAENMK